jgi:hypothetical protein
MYLIEDVMLQALERTGHDTGRRRAAPAPLKAKTMDGAAETYVEREDGLLATVGPIMMAAYALIFIVAILTFRRSGEALLALAICIAFGTVFFAVPLLMMHVRARHDTRWRRPEIGSVGGEVDTFTGPLRRAEAVVHVAIMPLAVSLAFAAFAAIWVLVGP